MELIDTVKTQGDVFVAFCTKLTEKLHCCFDVSSTTGSLTYSLDQLWSQFRVIRTSMSLRASWHELCRREQSDLVSNIAFQLVITRCIKLMIKDLTSQSACAPIAFHESVPANVARKECHSVHGRVRV